MDFDFLKSGFKIARIPFVENEPMAAKTTFKVGGTAAVFVTPETASQLQSALAGSAAAEVPYFLLGGGSNIVFPDGVYQGVVISTQNLNSITMTDDRPEGLSDDKILVTCEAGTPMAAFVKFCTEHNLKGAEKFAGLPGTIGGAVYMNARCFETSISDILYQTEHVEFSKPTQSKLITMDFNPSDWDYKKSPFQKRDDSMPFRFVTSATFCLTVATPAERPQIEAECKKYIAERVDKGHFKFPSAGSVFKNNHDFGAPSGKIIDQAGLRGYTIGGAQVAPFHGNFIINTNNATAADIKKLVEHVQHTVQEKTGFLLEPEIIFI